MATQADTMRAIREGSALLATGAVADFPRTVPTGPTVRHYGPFSNNGA